MMSEQILVRKVRPAAFDVALVVGLSTQSAPYHDECSDQQDTERCNLKGNHPVHRQEIEPIFSKFNGEVKKC